MFAGAAPAHAQIYRWLDGNGAMMYSTDRPADPGALKEFTVIDPVTRPPTWTVPADPVVSQPPPPIAREADLAPRPATVRDPDVWAPSSTSIVREAEAPSPKPMQEAPLPLVRESPATTSTASGRDASPAAAIPRERESQASTVREAAPLVLPPVTREAETRPRDTEVPRQARPERTTPSALAREIEAGRGAPAPESQPSRTITIIREPEPPARPAVARDKPSTPTAASQEADTSAPAKAASDAAPRRRARVNPNLPEAVQDPCLRSSDPKCYEKNKNAYVPFRGYSPSAAEARESGVIAPVGATNAAGAGGSASGGSTPKAPKASDYALPPGSDKPKKLSK